MKEVVRMALGALRIWIAGIAAVALAVSAPIAAQNYSDGYKFLKAVKDRDMGEANKLLQEPGSTVINARDVTSGETGLHLAISQRDLAWVRYLAGKGANPNIVDKKGVSPLMLACRTGFLDAVSLLVAAGAAVDEPNKAGETPLISAVHQKNTALMRVLLKAGADPDRTDNSGRTARDYARLDGANSLALAEIERSAKSNSDQKAESRETYGPSF